MSGANDFSVQGFTFLPGASRFQLAGKVGSVERWALLGASDKDSVRGCFGLSAGAAELLPEGPVRCKIAPPSARSSCWDGGWAGPSRRKPEPATRQWIRPISCCCRKSVEQRNFCAIDFCPTRRKGATKSTDHASSHSLNGLHSCCMGAMGLDASLLNGPGS